MAVHHGFNSSHTQRRKTVGFYSCIYLIFSWKKSKVMLKENTLPAVGLTPLKAVCQQVSPTQVTTKEQ